MPSVLENTGVDPGNPMGNAEVRSGTSREFTRTNPLISIVIETDISFLSSSGGGGGSGVEEGKHQQNLRISHKDQKRGFQTRSSLYTHQYQSR